MPSAYEATLRRTARGRDSRPSGALQPDGSVCSTEPLAEASIADEDRCAQASVTEAKDC